MSVDRVLERNGVDASRVTVIDMGNFFQVTKDGELLGYVIKDNWEWKPKGRVK